MIDALHLPYKGMVNNMWQDKIVAEPFLQLLISCIDVASYCGIEDVVLHISSTITPLDYNPNGLRFIEELLNHCEKKDISLFGESTTA